MPEGPEVATMAEQLRFFLESRVITAISFHSGKFVKHGLKNDLQNALEYLPLTVKKVSYKGKLIIISTFSETGKEVYFFSTLGMSGRWSHTQDKHAHIELVLEPKKPYLLNPENLYYVDPRCFGNFDAYLQERDWNKRIDSLKDGFLGEYIISKYEFLSNIEKNKKKNIAKSLMDQCCICSGVGNYLLSEICHKAEINPFSKWEDYDKYKYKLVYKTCKELINKSYLANGASVESFYDMDGEKGSAHFEFQVYGQEWDENGYQVIPVSGPHGRTVWLSSKHNWLRKDL